MTLGADARRGPQKIVARWGPGPTMFLSAVLVA